MSDGHNGGNWLTDILANRPFIVGLLFIGTYFVPFLALIGVVLAYVFRRNPEEEWELSHFQFLIRTFWLAISTAAIVLLGALLVVSAAEYLALGLESDSAIFGTIVALFVVMTPLLVLCGVRIVLSLMKSVSHKPIDNPTGWLG